MEDNLDFRRLNMNNQNMHHSKDSFTFPSEGRWVRLNVGGQIFQTTRQTLCREGSSFLARLCLEDSDLSSEKASPFNIKQPKKISKARQKDESGAFLIDRDAQYFAPILNYLRHGKLVFNDSLSLEGTYCEFKGVLEEADFYNLPGLSHLCAERILERDAMKKSTAETKHVYRVLQCHEDELTTVVSDVSDGWKFEQLIPVGTSFNYSTDVPPEYLCIVSRECPDVVNGNASESHDRAKFLQQKARNN
ncbi:inso-1 [Pristionchus pacificus]|uniref:Inso-1 n=1 Tax=Pristionchus pacificus TaxID=54126 RepID=A0A2A6D250_PRIPA|nr:inso-1 [Pristionchus pacificus]|eukprot:PDM84478.1 inso-1 [Pristionchus pacificus]